MTNELQNNKKIKTYSPLRLVGMLSLVVFFTIMLIIATFTRIKLINILQPFVGMLHPEFFSDVASMFAIKAYFYVPQVPVLLFSVTLLGAACTMTSAFFYIVLGLTFIPVFGLGGGFNYILQPYFGYILAFIPASLIAGGIMYRNHSIKNIFKAALTSVLIIHILGFFYMLLVLLLKHENFSYIMDWLLFESFTRAIYDLLLGFIAMLLAKLCRKFIWIITAV